MDSRALYIYQQEIATLEDLREDISEAGVKYNCIYVGILLLLLLI